jgi:hypothetical protein
MDYKGRLEMGIVATVLSIISTIVICSIIGCKIGFNFECAVIFLFADACFGRFLIRKEIHGLKYEIRRKL